MVRMRDGAQGQIGHPGVPLLCVCQESGATTFYTTPHTLYGLLRNAPSSVKLTQLQSVNRSQDLCVSSIINDAEEILQGSSWLGHSLITVATFYWDCEHQILPLPLPKCLLIKKWVWKYFNSLEIPDPLVRCRGQPLPPVWAWDWDEMNTREQGASGATYWS